jgi:hypothetical protein
VLGGAKHAHSGDRIVAREDHDFDARYLQGIERPQFLHQRERYAGFGRKLQALQLQLHVGAVIGGLKDAVLFFEIEQGTR